MRREDIKNIIEAIMFAYSEPITIKELNIYKEVRDA